MSDQAGRQLVVLIEGNRAGDLREDDSSRFQFTYAEEWQENPNATPISLSMPLAKRSHPHEVVAAFLWGLLPDNAQVIERWAQDFQVSPGNPFALVRHVGEDVAGAVQFVSTERVDEVLAGTGHVEWLTQSDIAEWLRGLRRDPTQWHLQETGQFSLAGAQAKGAFYYDSQNSRWGIPYDAIPTTHILKPAVTGFDDHDLNEHLCLETARLLGLPAAQSTVTSFDGERAIVIERYDRLTQGDGTVSRIHQEDLCQALGLPPAKKYQNEGGPSVEVIVDLLHREIPAPRSASDCVKRFIDALAFNWIIGGTDAHAKNYSLLLRQREVRLAPLYDVASSLPYDMYVPKLKLAMAIGGEYKLGLIEGRHWRRLASLLGLEEDTVAERVAALAAAVPDQIAKAGSAEAIHALDLRLPERLIAQVTERAEECALLLS